MGGGAGGESGFISAATSGPASQSGHGDGDDLLGGGDGSVHGGTGSEMGGGCYTGGPGSITGSSLYDLDSAHRSGKFRHWLSKLSINFTGIWPQVGRC